MGELVSVVIPVYNGSNYLSEAIQSVLDQTYSDIEIIVVNDGSNDGGKTKQIATQFGDKIRYFEKENGGASSALNLGIRNMKGEYFSWLSHDDLFYPNKIEEQMKSIQQSGNRVAACAFDHFWNDGRKVAIHILDFYGKEWMECSFFSVVYNLVEFGGLLFHRDIFEDYGLFDESLKTTQDAEFIFRIQRKEQFFYDNRCLYGIRQHPEQGTYTFSQFDRDRDELWVRYLTLPDIDEKRAMFGSDAAFEYQMLLRIWMMPCIDKSLRVVLERIDECTDWEVNQKEEIQKEKIYIYGAGAYGRRLLFDLRCRGIEVTGFVDGNPQKEGQLIDGIECTTPKQLLSEDKNTRVVIASIMREEIKKTVTQIGLLNYCYKEDVDLTHMYTVPKRQKIVEVVKGYLEKGWQKGFNGELL